MNFIFKQEIIDYDLTFSKKKKTILFLHGWGGNKNSFLPSIKILSSNFNLLTLTMPTIAPTIESWTLMDYTKLIISILKIHDIKSVIIICHSFGFRVASILKEFVTIEKIVVTAGAGIKKINQYKKIENENNIILLRQNRFKYLYELVASEEYKNLTDTNKITFKNIVNTNTKNFIKFSCPMLLFWGKFDSATKYKFAKYIKKKNNAKLISVNSDHFAYLKECALFNNAVIEFLCQ